MTKSVYIDLYWMRKEHFNEILLEIFNIFPFQM